MPDNLFRNKYRIPSARAVWHDYNGGAYFVTICTKDMAHFFGEIVDGEICLTEIGRCADECVRKMETLHNDIYVLLYVVMPNHIHLILLIDRCVTPVETPYYDVSTISNDRNDKMQEIANRCGLLSHIISRFKSAVTKYANENGISFAWQTRFHDRIIRDCDEMNGIAQYIENNVAQWESDEMNDE